MIASSPVLTTTTGPSEFHHAGNPERWLDIVKVLVKELESFFGPRDPRFIINVVRISDGNPHIFFPNSPRDTINVVLSKNALHDPGIALWQLAHESVHLLDPNMNPPSNNLEEGLATWYQGVKVTNVKARLHSYNRTKQEVYFHMDRLPSAIRSLRRQGYKIWNVPSKALSNAALIPKATADFLCSRFQRGTD